MSPSPFSRASAREGGGDAQAPAPPASGGVHFRAAAGICATAFAVQAGLQACLFFRPSPYGAPYVAEWDRYFFHALFYEVMGVLLLALPFLATWLLLHRRSPGRWAAWAHGLLIALLGLSIVANHFDHEVMRFMGAHPTPAFQATYLSAAAAGLSAWHALLDDRGGALLPVVILFAAPALFVFAAVRACRRTLRAGRPHALRTALALVLVPLAWTQIAYHTPGGKLRMRKVQPWIMSVWDEGWGAAEAGRTPEDLAALVEAHRRTWLAESGDPGWTFDDGAPAYLRRPVGPPPPADAQAPFNVIYLQVESLRAFDVGLHRPDRPASPTPFLDALAGDPRSAWWSRFQSFGPPTTRGFMAGHCSVAPHSRLGMTGAFPLVAPLCLPEVLRAAGWRAEHFSGADPDWDGQRRWLDRWYDRHVYDRDADELDAVVFERAAARIRELGAGGRPFLATIASITNHYPFRSRRPSSDVAGTDDVRDRILNTTHYTDEVIRAFYESLRDEPWFGRTLLVVTGDHGYNLGEHDGTPGQYNFHRESTWVPFIVHGAHPRLRPGRHDEAASMLDVAPTLADLLGVRVAVPWQGASLAGAGPSEGRGFTGARGEALFGAIGRHEFVSDPETGRVALFDGLQDPLQRRDLAAAHPDAVAAFVRRATADRRLNDYVIESSQVGAPPR